LTLYLYRQLEILHLEKHWLPYTLFHMMCLYATFCNVYLIWRGHKISKIIEEVVNTSVSFQIDGSQGIWIVSLLSQLVLAVILGFRIVLFVWRYTALEAELNGYLTMSTTRFFIPYIRTNLDLFSIVSPFIFILELYAVYAGAMSYTLPSILSLGISNIGHHWNFRVGLILGRLPTPSRVLKRIKNKLTYSYMFRYHLRIRKLIQDYSMDSFGSILTTFYCLTVSNIHPPWRDQYFRGR